MRHHWTRRRSTLLRRLSLVAASFVLGSAGWFLLGESESLTASEVPDQQVLARVDGIAITEDEVLSLAADDLRALERQRLELISKATREAVHRRLLVDEAARRGLSTRELLATEGNGSHASLIERLERGHTIEFLTEPAATAAAASNTGR